MLETGLRRGFFVGKCFKLLMIRFIPAVAALQSTAIVVCASEAEWADSRNRIFMFRFFGFDAMSGVWRDGTRGSGSSDGELRGSSAITVACLWHDGMTGTGGSLHWALLWWIFLSFRWYIIYKKSNVIPKKLSLQNQNPIIKEIICWCSKIHNF